MRDYSLKVSIFILDNQKGAITLENQNAFVSLNVSSMKELKFKFKLLRAGKSETIAVLRLADKTDIKVSDKVAL